MNHTFKLNSEQQAAVDTIFGTILVIAGPGTGKTQMLTTRIANILKKTDLNPENILCLTFTESAAVEMRNRLQKWIGSLAYRVHISTFHGFCQSILHDFPEFFDDQLIDFQVADDLEKAKIFRKIIDTKKWKYFRPYGNSYLYQRDFLGRLSDLKREYLTPEKFLKILPDEKDAELNNENNFYKRDSKYGKKGELKKGVEEKINAKYEKLEEFCELWQRFEAEKWKQKVYDFDDQILWVVEKIKTNKTLKQELQEKFQFILVDEYQDTNASQNEILWKLGDFDSQPNLFCVGDDDQSVFRFQGACLENLLAFKNQFPNAEILSLNKNYRSSQKILDAAFSSIQENNERLDNEKKLNADGANKNIEGSIKKAVFLSRSSEMIFLANQVQKELENGTPESEIAILARENREVKEIANYLQKLKIPVSTSLSENIFEDKNVLSLVQLMKIFKDPQLDHVFLESLYAPFLKISPQALMNLFLHSRNEKVKIANLLQKLTKEPEEGNSESENLAFPFPETTKENLNLPEEDQQHLRNFWRVFQDGHKNFHHGTPSTIAEYLFYETGLAAYVNTEQNTHRLDDLQKFKKFFMWLNEPNNENLSLEEILKKIELHQEMNIAIFPDPLPKDTKSVQIMTAHKSKGQEFKTVFITGLLDKSWGNKRSSNKITLPPLFQKNHDPNEDERRLFFVALTRAKEKLFLSYAEKDFAGREKSPSLFWHEIPEELSETLPTESIENSAHELLPALFQQQTPEILTNTEQDILKKLANHFVWSFSSLQTFLDCPRKFLLVHLLKVPTPPKKFFGYGIAIHKALELFLSEIKKTKKIPNETFLIETFKKEVEKQRRSHKLSELESTETFLHGEEILKNYYQKNLETFSSAQNWVLEKGFKTEIEGIHVYGKIDKIEVDLTQKTANLVDFKSGRPKPIKKEDRFWRQLVFYDLLTRNTKNLPWKIENFELEFLTPDYKGEFIKKDFQITEEDRTWVLDELKNADKKIKNLEFPFVENRDNDPEIDFWQNF